uniref:Uncharacterized protein n=1 Tax=Oryza rufipogon TaxID=4529 RepID=A0A0E0QKZ8_ORYRU
MSTSIKARKLELAAGSGKGDASSLPAPPLFLGREVLDQSPSPSRTHSATPPSCDRVVHDQCALPVTLHRAPRCVSRHARVGPPPDQAAEILHKGRVATSACHPKPCRTGHFFATGELAVDKPSQGLPFLSS